MGRGVRQGRCLSATLFSLYRVYLTKQALEGSGDLEIGQAMRTVKYADDPVSLEKGETTREIDKMNLEDAMDWT